mgnify:CR=1 FL=1
MNIKVHRVHDTGDATLSMVYVNNRLLCFGLEDEFREEKVQDETRIPAGVYDVKLRNEGGVTKRYQSRFPNLHRGMLHLQNVPGFTYIYIHMGNTDDHSSGCILVAERARIAPSGEITTPSSQSAYERLYREVVVAAENNELTCEIIDGDR